MTNPTAAALSSAAFASAPRARQAGPGPASPTTSAAGISAVAAGPRLVLRLEAALLLVAAVVAYRWLGGGWGSFAAGFLLPDLSLLAYLAGNRAGALVYNAAHTTLAPGGLALAALAVASPALGCAATLWLAHVGFDRCLGYGLKYAHGFAHTHLGVIGRRTSSRG